MIEKMADDLIRYMTEEKMIKENLKEDYTYALISILEKFITIGSILIISFVIRKSIPSILFLLFFLSLRKRTGGFHFRTFAKCYLATVVAYIIIVSISPILSENLYFLLVIFIIAICCIEFIGTVNHPNMNLDDTEFLEEKKKARCLALILGNTICILLLFKIDILYISYMSMAIILDAFLLVFAKLIKQEVKNHEKN